MKYLFLFSFLISFTLKAGDCEPVTHLEFEESDIKVCLLKSLNIIVSTNCENENCDAFKVLRDEDALRKIKLTSKDLNLGKNPSNVLCTALKGKLIWAKTKEKNELYFCKFKDKSLIDPEELLSKYHALNKE